jgi:hypothetical protein
LHTYGVNPVTGKISGLHRDRLIAGAAILDEAKLAIRDVREE